MIGGRYQSGFLRTTSKSEFHQRSWSIVNTLPTESSPLQVFGNPTDRAVGEWFIPHLEKKVSLWKA
jgi:hypothetical protein